MKETLQSPPPRDHLPGHIGIIMDGNGRWAKARGLPRKLGHRAGAKTFTKIVSYCRDIGIGTVTAYAFSTENWSRPREEVDSLMDLLCDYLSDTDQYKREDARLTFLGDRAPLRRDLQELMARAEEGSRDRTGIRVNLAINYGGRDEILHGVRALARAGADGLLVPEKITLGDLSDSLYTAGQRDPDLIIRPSGEQRLSNFLLWQSAYSELVFMHVLWPDFSPQHLNWALDQYAGRDRRFGGI